jgi:hypothetical protein
MSGSVQKITVASANGQAQRGALFGSRCNRVHGNEAGAALENCRALIHQINAGLSAEEPFVDVSSAIQLLFCLERAASAFKKSAPRPRERGETKIALNYH